ncbi:MAG: NAD-dependent epimerase/dehydratase family protein [Nitrospirales bacterium]
MNILIFGGSGFLGSFVADEFTKQGHHVTIFDKTPSAYLQHSQEMVVGNLLDRQAVHEVVDGQDLVYNFAGFADLNASINNPLPVLELNILGNANVLDACVTHSVSRFVYASTAYVFSSKGSFYGVSKRCSEKIIEEFSRQYDLDYTIIRYGSVYGPRSDSQNRIYKLVKQALVERKITFQGDGEEEREYIHVQDAATLSVQILAEQYRNQHVILTGVERFKYSQLLNMIREMMDDGIDIEYLHSEYQGHYTYTPYSFTPEPGKKMICNPFIDFGQGLLQTISEIHQTMQTESVIPQ